MQEKVIQRIVFPVVGVCDCEQLYYRSSEKINGIGGEKILLKKGQCVSFDTYINALSASKWKKYTVAQPPYSLKITLKGKYKVNLIHSYLSYAKEYGKKQSVPIVHSDVEETRYVDCVEQQTLTFPYSATSGCLSFSLQAESDGEFFAACYVCQVLEDIRNINLGVGICTYKREEYVKNNMEILRKSVFENRDSVLFENLHVFISDNASTLPTDMANENVRLFVNKNAGGSGGFTRCMIEAIKYNETASRILTHFVLMDDDVRFDPISLERTYILLTLMKDDYLNSFIGGAMFRMAEPSVQYASGEYWFENKCDVIKTYNLNADMTEISNVVKNEVITDANYQGWWFCAIPMSVISKDNLPLPFFIKYDDIEYSLRNNKELILLNGINVWHESFESKYSAQNVYYTVRNYLITAAARNAQITKEDFALHMRISYRHYACNYKYLEIEHFCNAVDDFLKGVDYLKNLDLETMHKNVMPQGYKMVDVSELPVPVTKERYLRDTEYSQPFGMLKRLLAKYTANGLIFPARGYSVVGMWDGSHEQTYRKKFLVRYEPNTNKGFVLNRSLKKFLKASRHYNRTKRNFTKKFDKAFNEYKARWRELCTLDVWQKLLDLD